MNHRYYAAAHAVQAGTKMKSAADFTFLTDTERRPYNDVRTGLNIAMAEFGGLSKLLMAKGLFTEAEYMDAMIAGLEQEKARMEAELSAQYKIKVTLV